MIILELRFHDLVLKEYTFKEGGRLTIGRHPDNDIPLPKPPVFHPRSSQTLLLLVVNGLLKTGIV
jgi:hypothetical protein